MADENKFDGQTPVPGYTLFHGKDGKSYYLKGESLSDEDVTQRVAKLRGSASTAGTDTTGAQPTNAPAGIGKRLNDWWTTPTPDIRGGKWTPPGETRPESSSSPQQRTKDSATSAAIMGAPFVGVGLATAPIATAMGLGGAVAGGAAGGYAGRKIGERVGAPDFGEDIGGLLGSGFGGYGGGRVGAALVPRIAGSSSFASVPNRTLGDVLESPSKAPSYAFRKLFPQPPQPFDTPAQGTGALFPSSDEFYQQKGDALMKRGAEQSVLDRKAALSPDPVAAAVKNRTAAWLPTKIAPPAPELGSPENPGWMSKLPTRMPSDKMGDPFNPVPSELPEAMSPLDPQGNDLISRTRRLTIPGQTPSAADLKQAGDYTQAPLGRLQSLAKFGDKLAQNEINRRLQTNILPWEQQQ